MCAGGEGRDACQGFGGAPLVIRENGVYSQVSFVVELLITRWVKKNSFHFRLGLCRLGRTTVEQYVYRLCIHR
jgi:hypothetical protein